jgi:ssDNA-binding Zn-finger/Zn-ribbon topoisomerase 1
MQGRLFDVCPECHEKRDIVRGKTLESEREYCACPTCGHLWDPKKGAERGETRNAKEESSKVEGKGPTAEESAEWALGGKIECHEGPGGFLVRIVRSGNGSIKAFKGRGTTRVKALVSAYRSYLTGRDD